MSTTCNGRMQLTKVIGRSDKCTNFQREPTSSKNRMSIANSLLSNKQFMLFRPFLHRQKERTAIASTTTTTMAII